MAKQNKYTRSARGQECQIRIPGVCNYNPETTVLAHLNGAGIGMKHPDIFGSYACSDCHDVVDARKVIFTDKTELTHDDIKLMHLEGVIRTQRIMIDSGVLKL